MCQPDRGGSVGRNRFFTFGRSPAREAPVTHRDPRPDWQQADPRWIARASARASAKPTGGWAVLDASARIRGPRAFTVAGRELVAWRGSAGLRVAPASCPHMGASLCGGRVDERGRIVCPWHGLALGDARHGSWAPLAAFDDGVLSWVQLPELLAPGEAPTDAPILTARPARHLDGVLRTEGRCLARDVIANRLDPWHGVHFHPHAFLRLSVLEKDEDAVTVRVVYRVLGPLGMEVDARFACPDARTIAMTIVRGDGVGSVVETHATPIDAERTAIVEATLATSDRLLFPLFARARRWIRPLIEERARRLWVEDVAYAERTYALRKGREPSDGPDREAQPSDAMKPRGGTE